MKEKFKLSKNPKKTNLRDFLNRFKGKVDENDKQEEEKDDQIGEEVDPSKTEFHRESFG